MKEEFLKVIQKEFGIPRKTLDQQLRVQAQLLARMSSREEVNVDTLDTVRHEGSLSRFQKQQIVSESILCNLNKVGRLLNSDRGIFYLDDKSGQIHDIYESEFSALCNERYRTNAAEQEWKYLLADIEAWAIGNGGDFTVREFAYYNTKSNVLYVSQGTNRLWKLGGNAIKDCQNGTDDVFLRPLNFEEVKLGDDLPHLWEQRVFKYLNLDHRWGLSREQSRLLLRVWIWSLFFSELLPTRPILCLLGEKGSGKSSLLRIMGKAIFGGSFDVNAMTQNVRDLETLLVNARWVVMDNFDNKTSGAVLDLLATAATGGEITRRRLYTTAETQRYKLSCFIAVTSRTPQFQRDDIAERLLIIGTERIKSGKFKPESEMIKSLLSARNHLWKTLHSDLNRIVKQRRSKFQPKPIGEYRMADFANFGLKAVEKKDRQLWRDTMKTLAQSQSTFLLTKDPVVCAIRDWLISKETKAKAKLEFTASGLVAAIWRGRSDEALDPITLGRRLKNSSDPLHRWVEVKQRYQGGVSKYYLNLTEEGRKSI